MTKKPLGYVKYNNRYYEYFIQDLDKNDPDIIEISIPGLKFSTSYVREDLALFLDDVENILDMHLDIVKEEKSKSSVFRFRLTESEKSEIERRAKASGYNNSSAFVRDLALAKT